MKNKSIICALLVACGVGISSTSCQDMLSADSDRTTSSNAKDTLYGYWGIMKAVQNIAERYVILGEARADLVYPTSYAADTISNIANFNMTKDGDCRYLEVKDYYRVINSCNNYLADVDSLKTNSNGDKVMEKEIAQVLAVRAWTYLQLVNNYGEVPYFTEPITSLGFVDDFDLSQAKNKLNRESLIEKLIPALMPYVNVPMPNYGNYNNGAVDISSTLTMFPMRLVMGDIYLTGAKGQGDYELAAQSYYDYLKDHGAYLPTQFATAAREGVLSEEPTYVPNSWIDIFNTTTHSESKNYSGEVITSIPSAAGKLYGSVLTGVCNVFGYETSSRMDTNSEEGSESQATTSASVSAFPNTNFRQLGPSEQYFSLCQDQVFVEQKDETLPVTAVKNAGDARQSAVRKMISSSNTGFNETNFVGKPAMSGFSYTFPVVYRKALVWLRYAEAVNRAGFPSYAFAVLKDGLCKEYLPAYKQVINEIVPELPEGMEEWPEGQEPEVTYDTVTVYDTENKACHYIPQAEYDLAQSKPFLQFTTEFTSLNGTVAGNKGVHSRGCGEVGIKDTIFYTYKNMVFKKSLEMGADTLNLSQEDVINAVENLIVDELALETAWEGNRYPDLLRIASHKGDAGVQWFADKIARRGDTRNPDVDYTTTADYQTLYQKLLNKDNWYLTLPSHK